MEKKRTQSQFDYTLLVIMIFLLAFGLVMLYSASSYTAQMEYDGNSMYYLNKQLKNLAMASLAFFAGLLIDYHWWHKFDVWWLVVAIGAILLVLVCPAEMTNGAVRWVKIGPISFQPSEISKIAMIIFIAIFVSSIRGEMKNKKIILFIMGVALVIAGLVLFLNSNLSTAIIIVVIAAVMCFVAYKTYTPFIMLAIVAVICIAGFVFMVDKGFFDPKPGEKVDYKMARILVWREPENYASDGGFQVLQGLYAIGSGGLFGKGFGNSIQKLGFIPEAQNDMIFSIICEELGLFGAVGIILVFMVMIWRFMLIAGNAPDLFGSMLVVGIMAHIAIQVILNIAVVTNTIPNTGVTLPFISYGGSSLMFLMFEMGLVFNVSKQIKMKI